MSNFIYQIKEGGFAFISDLVAIVFLLVTVLTSGYFLIFLVINLL
jgi:hypothetical protein